MGLSEDGYVLLPSVLTDKDIHDGLSSIEGNQVDYVKMKQFIDGPFLNNISQYCRSIPSPRYVKFRFSDNNNATDAATFHGDIYNHSPSKLMPIYTCLCYFDKAQLEVVPGSHLPNKKWSVQQYQDRKVLDMKRGDILVFHANMHHRGINYYKTPHRRLLQVFEVFPDRATYEEHAPKLIMVQTSTNSTIRELVNPLMIQLAKNTTAINLVNFCHYMFVNNDLQYKVSLMDIEPWHKRGNYVSYEPVRRVKMEDIQYEDLNVNIICDSAIQTRGSGKYYLYWFLVIIVMYLLYRFYKMPKAQRNKLQKKYTV